MFEATDGLLSHTRQQTRQRLLDSEVFDLRIVRRDPGVGIRKAGNRKQPLEPKLTSTFTPREDQPFAKRDREKIKDFYRATPTDYLTYKAI